MTTVLVSGVLAGKAGNGGNAWTRLSFVSGFRRLGLDVVFVEQLAEPPIEAQAYFRAVCAEFGLDGHLLAGDAGRELIERAGGAALLVNIGGHLTLDSIKNTARVRVYVDDDPGYTQIWQLNGLLG